MSSLPAGGGECESRPRSAAETHSWLGGEAEGHEGGGTGGGRAARRGWSELKTAPETGRASLETGTIGIIIIFFRFKLFPLCIFVAMACGIRVVVCIIISTE